MISNHYSFADAQVRLEGDDAWLKKFFLPSPLESECFYTWNELLNNGNAWKIRCAEGLALADQIIEEAYTEWGKHNIPYFTLLFCSVSPFFDSMLNYEMELRENARVLRLSEDGLMHLHKQGLFPLKPDDIQYFPILTRAFESILSSIRSEL